MKSSSRFGIVLFVTTLLVGAIGFSAPKTKTKDTAKSSPKDSDEDDDDDERVSRNDSMKVKCAKLLTSYEDCLKSSMGSSRDLVKAQEACSYQSLLLSTGGCGSGKESSLSPTACTDALGSYEEAKNEYKTACSGNADCNTNLQQCLASAGGDRANQIRLSTSDVTPNASQMSFNSNTCRDLKAESSTLENLQEAQEKAEEDRKDAREKYREAQEKAQEAMNKAAEDIGELQKQLLEQTAGLSKIEEQIQLADRAYAKRIIKAKGDAAQTLKQHKSANLGIKQKIKELKQNIKTVKQLGQKKIAAATSNALTKKKSSCTEKYTEGGGDTEYNRYVSAFVSRGINSNTNLPIASAPVASNLNEHLGLAAKKKGNFLEEVRQVYIQRCIQQSVNSYDIESIMRDEDAMLTESNLQMEGLSTQIENLQEQMAQMASDIPQDLALMEEDAVADVNALKQDRDLAVKAYQNAQQQLQQMQMMIAQKQAQIPQAQQLSQQGVMQAGQYMQAAELRYNQITQALGTENKAANIITREKLKSIGDKTDEGLKAYGKMDANQTKAYRSCCFNGAPAASVGGFVTSIFCQEGKRKETRQSTGLAR